MVLIEFEDFIQYVWLNLLILSSAMKKLLSYIYIYIYN